MDAAAELPSVVNLQAFTDAGANLLAFSGGKAIRGPQITGILAGRADLVESVAPEVIVTIDPEPDVSHRRRGRVRPCEDSELRLDKYRERLQRERTTFRDIHIPIHLKD